MSAGRAESRNNIASPARVITAFSHLLTGIPRAGILLLLTLMLLVGLSDGVGILLLVPLLEVLQNQEPSHNVMAAAMILRAMEAIGLARSDAGLLVVFMLLITLRALIQYLRDLESARLQHSLVDRMRQRCFQALMHVEWRWLTTGRSSDHANLLLSEVSRIGTGVHFGLSLLATLACIVFYLLAACALSWSMTLLTLSTGALIFSLLAGQRKKALELGHGMGHANRQLQATVQESLAGIKLTKILGSEQRHLAFFSQIIRQVRQQQLRFTASTHASRALLQVGGALLLSGYLYAGLRMATIPLAELLTLVLVFGRLIPQFTGAQQQYHHLLHALPAIRQIERLLAECATFAEPDAAGAASDTPWPIERSITLENVTVQYQNRDRPALDGISLILESNTTTAVIGPSCAGKSTLADVLMGLLRVDGGHMRVDDTLVQGGMRMRWRHAVAYVPQEIFLFHDTIRRNLLWSAPDAGESELRLSLQRAAADFVFVLPQGLDTVVGDGGIQLSGGERQRIALARALLKRPSLLILDEATSALDQENEMRILQALENLQGRLTVVLIGHRLATLEHADQVLVMSEGRIEAQGDWNQLCAGRAVTA